MWLQRFCLDNHELTIAEFIMTNKAGSNALLKIIEYIQLASLTLVIPSLS